MLVKWNPIPATIFSEFEKALWQDWNGDRNAAVEFAPHVDVIEEKDKFTVRVELPGVKRENVKATLENQVLILTGEKKREQEKQDANYHRREVAYGKFERRFRLGNNVDREHIKADFKDGVLEITLPKTAQAQSKEIEIRIS
ncbi:MAG: Hsp20/alpha crystallin family protein [bacterium]